MTTPASVSTISASLGAGVAAASATIGGGPRSASSPAAVDRFAASVLGAPSPTPAGTAGFTATILPAIARASAALTPPDADETQLSLEATRVDPTLTITGTKVNRAAIGRVFLASNAYGTSIQRGTTADQAETMRGLLETVVNSLKDRHGLEEEVKDITVFYDRAVIKYVDTGGNTIEQSILAEMESDPELTKQVHDLSQCAHEIHGTPGYVAPALSSKVKGTLHGTAALRRSERDGMYRAKKAELKNINAQITDCETKIAGMPRVMTPSQIAERVSLSSQHKSLTAMRAETQRQIDAFVLHERIPRTVAEAKAMVEQPVTNFEDRTDLASSHLTGLRAVLEAQYKTKQAAYQAALSATPPTPKDQLEKMKKELSALRKLQFRIDEVDEYALTMALAHCPKIGSSDAAIHAAAEKVRTAVDAHYRDAQAKEYQERQVKERTWGQYLGFVPNNPTLEAYNSDYAVDVGGLLYNASVNPSMSYHTYCLDHGTALKAPHFTDVFLSAMLKLEKDPNYDVEVGLSPYLKDLADDDRAAVVKALADAKTPKAPAPAPTVAAPVGAAPTGTSP